MLPGPAARLEKLGFKDSKERRRWIQEHSQEILNYSQQHGVLAAVKHFHIARETLNRLVRQLAHSQTQPPKDGNIKNTMNPITAVDLADALLDRMIVLKSDNYTLKQENINLREQVKYLEEKLKTSGEEATKQFQEKLQKALANPGD